MTTSYPILEQDVPQSYRDKILKWNGWGYNDSMFTIDKAGHVTFTGDKYDISGKTMPHFRPWFESYLGIDLNHTTPAQKLSEVPIDAPVENDDIIEYLTEKKIAFSNAPRMRLIRSHGHTVHELMNLREGKVPRLPDLVVWPKSEAEITTIIEGAMSNSCVIIPIGGGTSVSNALDCPDTEKRFVISLDMALMDKILWIDRQNLTCRAQAGIVGQSLERQLNDKGFTCGHEPDSIEFSTLGGWVSTRASGMKKNKYGNIEDLVVHINFVSPKGLIQRQCQVPRISSGPDIQQIIMGSEGTLGVVSEVTLKVFPLPEVKKYGSFVFPDFECGVNFFREVARQRIQPASLRLMDNEQFVMGQALKVANNSYWDTFKSSLSKMYITKWKGFKVDEICAATCVYEGSRAEVEEQEQRLNQVAETFRGVVGGEENGKYGYRLTFAIAYLRDLGMNHGVLGESFETSVPWDKVHTLCRNVKELMRRESKNQGVQTPVLASCRVTQVYDAGACVYFYYGFNSRGLEDGLKVYDRVETAARDEIIACGGSISHHHGVGKLRKPWMLTTNGAVGIALLKAIKSELDPANVFANANLVDIIGSPHCKL
ncbi:unnamed protein product [Caenorhabditis auriculariae]|uniref:Alkylglycerone-phosphate synthase n=1 Tax=Caenorhabditis auriculariae TaxID=2777116 RepID=A0A8S1HTS3_9PELO|nr:unnamed protein product [Caenorhabditis auriculariae]